ncbi:hypothetical protein AVEN_165407-1 [Araneus ventricosus]|uniref:Uncharacterized protein n=1 Tax=Araneus ventricosus TaxID=182803 RepID=A0A4Y2AT73_ARAVE|nr:hypothetical protein AVEN_165407-1 [Araneus ventricosus]
MDTISFTFQVPPGNEGAKQLNPQNSKIEKPRNEDIPLPTGFERSLREQAEQSEQKPSPSGSRESPRQPLQLSVKHEMPPCPGLIKIERSSPSEYEERQPLQVNEILPSPGLVKTERSSPEYEERQPLQVKNEIPENPGLIKTERSSPSEYEERQPLQVKNEILLSPGLVKTERSSPSAYEERQPLQVKNEIPANPGLIKTERLSPSEYEERQPSQVSLNDELLPYPGSINLKTDDLPPPGHEISPMAPPSDSGEFPEHLMMLSLPMQLSLRGNVPPSVGSMRMKIEFLPPPGYESSSSEYTVSTQSVEQTGHQSPPSFSENKQAGQNPPPLIPIIDRAGQPDFANSESPSGGSCSGCEQVRWSTMPSSVFGLSEVSYPQPSVRSDEVVRPLLPTPCGGTTGQPTSTISSPFRWQEQDRQPTPRPSARTRRPSPYPLPSGGSGRRRQPTPPSFGRVQYPELPDPRTGHNIGSSSPPSPDRGQTTQPTPLPLSYMMWRKGRSSPHHADNDSDTE